MTRDSYRFEPVDTAGLEGPVVAARDIVFGRVGSRDLRLDLFRPAAPPASALPVVVFIHGGGWHAGDKESYADLAARVASHGYLCASVDYRLSGEAPFPAGLEDCKRAVRWLRAHPDRVGADPAHFGVWGHSAGAHLAAMVALTPGRFEGEDSQVSSRVQCAVCHSTPFDLSALDRLSPSVDAFLGSPPTDRAAREQASPIGYVTASAAAFLVCQGELDDLVPVEQSDRFVAAMRGAGAPVEFLRVPGVGHDVERCSEEIFARALAFLDAHLKPRAA